MPSSQDRATLRQFRTLFHVGTTAELTDGQLMERFATGRGEAAELAFGVLVERHGALVLHACRSILIDEHDAQDAFQATFLVLVRKARSLWVRDSLGPWLHQVACRAARGARSARHRRRFHEQRAVELAPPRSASDMDASDFAGALHEEIGRMPERYRAAIVLCELEGYTHEQAARHLGCAVGTIKSRLARGREQLGDRLRRRGLSPSSCVSATALAPGALRVPPTRVPVALKSAALRAAAGCAEAGEVPASVLSLASGALWMMRVNALKSMSAVVLGLVAIGSSVASPGSSSPPTGGVKAVAAQPMIAYEVSWLETPGLSFHKIGQKPDFEIRPSVDLAFLSDLELDLVQRKILAEPGASALRFPEAVARSDEQAIFVDPRNGRRPFSLVGPRAAGDADRRGPSDGRTVRLRGRLSPDGRYLAIDVDIQGTHVVTTHTLDLPGRDGNAGRVEVPEVVRMDTDHRVTIAASGGAVLIGLGPVRTVDASGKSSIAEHHVLLRIRQQPEPAAKR